MACTRTVCALALLSVVFTGCEDDKPPVIKSKVHAVAPPASVSAAPAVSATASAAPVEHKPPKRLAEGTGLGKTIAIHGDHVYWVVRAGAACDKPEGCPDASDGKIERVPKAGGIPQEVIGGLYNVASLAFDTQHVFWTMCGAVDYVQRCQVTMAPMDGGKRSVLFDAGPEVVDHVQWVGNVAVWTEPGKKRLQRSDTRQSAPTLYAKTGDVTDTAAHGDSLYWCEGRSATPDGSIKKSVAGAPPVTLAPKRRMPLHLAVDGEHVYWTETVEVDGGPPDNEVLRVPVAGGEPEPVLKGLPYLDGLVVSGDKLVFVTTDAVGWAPKSGGEPKMLATKLTAPHGPAADDTHAYWIADNKVWQIEFPK